MQIKNLRDFKSDGDAATANNFIAAMREHVLEPTYSLSFNTRYSLYRRVHNENVAEHSFYVAFFVLVLHEYFEFDLKSALTMALLHDIPELHVSDVNHKIKARYPQIAESIRRAEYEFVMKALTQSMSSTFVCSSDDSQEALVMQLADVLSVLQWVDNEIAMGNTTVSFIVGEATERIEHLFNRMLPWLR